jgi:predicted flap endonuclease-1-like 5' DNA nuclease
LRIEGIEGIGPVYAEKLRAAGIETVERLLEAGRSRAGRHALARVTGIEGSRILGWVDEADLMRVRGVGSEYADLLELAGVDSPAELARRNASDLATTLEEVVAARPGVVRRVPTVGEVAGWVEQAKGLEKIVEH